LRLPALSRSSCALLIRARGECPLSFASNVANWINFPEQFRDQIARDPDTPNCDYSNQSGWNARNLEYRLLAKPDPEITQEN
jgi:hypothetical protein